MSNIWIVLVPGTDYIRAYTTERRAKAWVEQLKREGLSGLIYHIPINFAEEE